MSPFSTFPLYIKDKKHLRADKVYIRWVMLPMEKNQIIKIKLFEIHVLFYFNSTEKKFHVKF